LLPGLETVNGKKKRKRKKNRKPQKKNKRPNKTENFELSIGGGTNPLWLLDKKKATHQIPI